MECKECGILRESKKTTWYTTKQLCSRCYNRLYSRKYRIEKKEIVKSHNKTYYENNKQKIRKYKIGYNIRHREKNNRYSKKYHMRNRAIRSASEAKRRASKLNATPSWLTIEHINQIKMFYKIAQDLRWEDEMHVDHIIPLQGKEVCGMHVPWNLQVIEGRKNCSKGNRLQG